MPIITQEINTMRKSIEISKRSNSMRITTQKRKKRKLMILRSSLKSKRNSSKSNNTTAKPVSQFWRYDLSIICGKIFIDDYRWTKWKRYAKILTSMRRRSMIIWSVLKLMRNTKASQLLNGMRQRPESKNNKRGRRSNLKQKDWKLESRESKRD